MDSKLLLITPVPTQPTQFMKSAVNMFGAEARKLGIDLHYEIDCSVEEHNIDWVVFDPSRALQVRGRAKITLLVTNQK